MTAPCFKPGKLYRRSAVRGFTEQGLIVEADGIRVLGYYRWRPPSGVFNSWEGDMHVRWIGLREGGRLKNFHYPRRQDAINAATWARQEAKLP